MKIKVNANRMNLLKLRRRLKFAIRGHKLLKDKQEQLTKEFNFLITELIKLREKLENNLSHLYKYLQVTLEYSNSKKLNNIFANISKSEKFEIKEDVSSKFNMVYKKYSLDRNLDLSILTNTDPYINEIVKKAFSTYSLILEIANFEYLCEILAKDLQTTRRRVNALEYVLIPQIKERIKYIVGKLNEFERTNLTQLMRIKQLM
ncbi:MAG: V-type ATP synthase subunit D [Endomicrobia bacterium]|nr:V-type ATP synthase subunit D [Endomicrobiia bacterium]